MRAALLAVALFACKPTPSWSCVSFVHGEDFGDACFSSADDCAAERNRLATGHREVTACEPRDRAICLRGTPRCFGTPQSCEKARLDVRTATCVSVAR